MILNTAGKNLLLAGTWDPTGLTAGLFTSDDYASDEVTGTGYARQAVAFDAPVGGVLAADSENLAEFTIPEGVDFSHGALFSGATRVAEGAVTAQSYPTGGTYILNDATITLNDSA